MQPFKVILAEALQGEVTVPVVTAHSLSFQFQNNGMPGEASNDLSDGNIRIGGKHTLLLQNGTLREVEMPLFEIRLKEQEALIPNLNGDAQVKEQAKFDIWNTFHQTLKAALDTALKAQYEQDQQNAEGGQA